MPIVSGREILEQATNGGYAVGGFDAFNMESVQGIIAGAESVKMPVFLQFCILSVEYATFPYARSLVRTAAELASVPVCIHLDHGPGVSDIKQLEEAMDFGFESIMVDGSSLPLEENIALTKKVIEIARRNNLCVEGELGGVSRNTNATKEEIENLKTKPDEAKRYVEATGVDYMAVSIGSVSGFFEGKVELDIERLQQINQATGIPLVLHGGTGIPEDQLKEAIRNGIRKVNIAHGLRKSFLAGISNVIREDTEQRLIDPREVLSHGRDAVKQFVVKKIRQLAG